ncbi:MAG: SAF domain-containing protein [Gordonia sp. (in: high G+C Gram-positive bacteria)]|uniref:SAF domain-containing protein n=1 Tax=Gordonia sp. (in: high G+C Gram-positive bacteria) TaxID=84139 RepID=UPI0039E46F2A
MTSDPLSARLVDRVTQRLRPGRLRSVAVRRALAAAFVVAAVLVLIAGRSGAHTTPVLVAARDLRPGSAVAAGDVVLRRLPAGAELEGMLSRPDDAVGARLSGAIAAGEPITRTRLLSGRSPAALTGHDDARLVPVRPADASMTSLLRVGDTVDVLDDRGEVLARSAVVAVTADPPARGGAGEHPVLLAMPAGDAVRVASTGLSGAVTVILH